jgi:transposase
MQSITTIGLDIAKSVFQVHGVDAGGQVVVRRQLKRRYVLAFFQASIPTRHGETQLRGIKEQISSTG